MASSTSCTTSLKLKPWRRNDHQASRPEAGPRVEDGQDPCGRGEGSKGKTAGRGTKGTKARKNVPVTFEGGQMPIHMRLPKLKGFRTGSAPSTPSSMSANSPRRSPRAAPSVSTNWLPRAWFARTSW